MAFVHGKETSVYIAEYDLQNQFNQLTISKNRQTVNVTPYGNDDYDYISGLGDGSMSFQGLWDSDSGKSDDVLGGTLTLAEQRPVTVSLQGATAIGQRAHLMNGRATEYGQRAPINDAIRISSNNQADGGLFGGVILHHDNAETSTGNFTSVDHGASTSFGLKANLHVTAFTGTTATVKIQDSADDATFADLVTFTAATGVTYQHEASVTGAVNRYLRVNLTGTFTSITFVVSAARLLQ